MRAAHFFFLAGLSATAVIAACESFGDSPDAPGNGSDGGDLLDGTAADGSQLDGTVDPDGTSGMDGSTTNDRPSSLALGAAHTCVVMEDAAVACWGANDRYQLGGADGGFDGSFSPSPVRVAGLPPIVGLAAGREHTCAIDDDAGVWCWGDNSSGQLAIGVLGGTQPPVRPLAPAGNAGYLAGVTSIGLGSAYTCIALDGDVYCAGGNGQVEAEIDSGTTIDKKRLNKVPLPVNGDVRRVAVGLTTACAATTDDVVCWGSNESLQAGSPGGGRIAPTVAQVGDAGTTEKLALGTGHSCLVEANGRTWCWGGTSQNSCGAGGANPGVPAQSVVATSKAVAAGGDETCFVATNGSVSCMGRNNFGQLGIATVSASCPNPPAVIPNLTANSVAVGRNHACALPVDGGIVCWGANDAGQLGTGNVTPSSSPVLVP